MNILMISLVVVLVIAGGKFAAPTAQAQTLHEILDLASDAEAASKKVNGLADQLEKMVNETSKNKFLIGYAPAETADLGQSALAAAKSLRHQGQAYEMMAAKLRDHARTMR